MSLFAPTPEVIAALKARYNSPTNDTASSIPATAAPFDDTIDVVVYDPAAHSSQLPALLPALVAIHIDCILTDNTIATFTTPIDAAKKARMLAWWGDKADEVRKGTREIVLAFAAPTPGTAPSTSSASQRAADSPAAAIPGVGAGKQLAGYVMLAKPVTETGPFRGPVEKLLVSPRFRRRGIARMVMARLEDVARRQGRWLLVSFISRRWLCRRGLETRGVAS